MPKTLQVKIRDRWYTVEVNDLGSVPVTVLVNKEPVEVHIKFLDEDQKGTEQSQPVLDKTRTSVRTDVRPEKSRTLNCPMPGIIISIAVNVGDKVNKGDEICVLEAMKMHQTLRSDYPGIAKTVHVHPGQTVNTNDPILEFD